MVKFHDPVALRGVLLGPRGCHVNRIETLTGARLRYCLNDGGVLVRVMPADAGVIEYVATFLMDICKQCLS